MRYKAVTLGLVLAGTTLGSAALNLGRARGAAWIGQPLELLVPMQVDAGQADTALCAEADVFHGDSRQDANRVQVQALPTDQPETFNLMITSSALVDEPVVSVYVRAGCNQKSSRKFVLLADFPGDSMASQSRTVTAVVQPVPSMVPTDLPMPVTVAASSASPASTSKPKAASAPAGDFVNAKVKAAAIKPEHKNALTAKRPIAEKAAEAAGTAKAATSNKPRLRLDPIETLAERVKTLESTTPTPTGQDDLARDSQKMLRLQTDLRSLLDQAAKNDASLAAMRERLEKAESDRVPVALVYGLLALIALALGALIFLWTKRPKAMDWEDSHGHRSGPVSKRTAMPMHEGSTDIDLDLADFEAYSTVVGTQTVIPKKP
jgi:hypothetical protein